MNESFRVNYTDQVSQEAEKNFPRILERLSMFEVSTTQLDKTNEQIVSAVELSNPERLELVLRKTLMSKQALLSLPQNILVDKLLGIDHVFSFQGSICAVDVATGKASSLINKRNKFIELKKSYESLGIAHAIILRVRKEIDDDVLTEIIARVDDAVRKGEFVIDLRIN